VVGLYLEQGELRGVDTRSGMRFWAVRWC